MLFYDNEYGNLVLARVGTTKAACGFQEGVNIIRAQGTFTLDQRFSFMAVRLQALAFLNDLGNQSSVMYPPTGEPVVTYDKNGNPTQWAYFPADKGVVRFRNKNIISDYALTSVNGTQYMELLWKWETKRRYGRSFKVDLTTDSWRDSGGKLWTPNTLIDIAIPSIRMLNNVTYVISEVTYMRDDENGTTCQIVAMPPDAFNVQPIILVPITPDAGGPLPLPGNAANTKATQQPLSTTTNANSPAPASTGPSLVGPVGPNQPLSNASVVQLFDPPDDGK